MRSNGAVKAQSRRIKAAVKYAPRRMTFDAATAAQSGVRAPQRCDCEQREAPLRGTLWLTHLWGMQEGPVRRGEARRWSVFQ